METNRTMPGDPGGPARRIAVFVALAGFAAYAILTPSSSGMGDSSEFALVLATLGVAHPTGYPLYTLFGHGFCLLLHALGVSWTYAAGLWSAVGGAVALYLLTRLGTELIGEGSGAGRAVRLLAVLVPVSLFAFQPVVLEAATQAEVNIWSLAWACGATLAFVRMSAAIRGGRADSSSPARRGAILWGLICGTGLAHHLTSVLISAPLTVGLMAMASRRRRLAPALLLWAAGAALLPISSYGIIAWRAWHPARVQWAWLEPSLAGVLTHITGGQYRLFMGHFAPAPLQEELLRGAVYPFLIPGLAFLGLGLIRARLAEQRITWAAMLAGVATLTTFTYGYGVPDPAPYFLPAMALGVSAAAPALASIPWRGQRKGELLLGALGLAGLMAIVPWLRDGNQQRLATLSYEKVIRSMWSSIPPDTAIVSWTDDRFNRLVGYQLLRGEKPALLIVTPDLLFAPSIRRKVLERFGTDPVVDFQRPQIPVGMAHDQQQKIIDESRRRLVQNLNARVRVPVILFDPSVPVVWRYDKPSVPEAAGGLGRPPETPSGGARPGR